MERMKKPKFIKEIEKSEGKERAKCGRWYIRVYGELDHKPMVELESLEIVVKELHKLEEENKKLKLENAKLEDRIITDENFEEKLDKENKNLKEKVETLELWLDNKEKLNEEYRDKIDLLKYQSYGPSELADSLYDANKTIEKLREEIKKIEKNQEYRYHRCMKAEKQYEHSMGEDDELIYEEGLYD